MVEGAKWEEQPKYEFQHGHRGEENSRIEKYEGMCMLLKSLWPASKVEGDYHKTTFRRSGEAVSRKQMESGRNGNQCRTKKKTQQRSMVKAKETTSS